jgi:hypothetical protein
LNLQLRLQLIDTLFEPGFQIRFVRDVLGEIGLGLGRLFEPQPQHPAVGIDIRLARTEREGLVVIGQGPVVVELQQPVIA